MSRHICRCDSCEEDFPETHFKAHEGALGEHMARHFGSLGRILGGGIRL